MKYFIYWERRILFFLRFSFRQSNVFAFFAKNALLAKWRHLYKDLEDAIITLIFPMENIISSEELAA